MPNSLDTDQVRHFVGPEVGPNCLQRLSADNTSRQRDNLQVEERNIANMNTISLSLLVVTYSCLLKTFANSLDQDQITSVLIWIQETV